jgi:prolipoprotein diacylglyceryltransferase
MYPNFYYLFQDLFGVEWSGLIFINTFGFFVAIAFLVANYMMMIELRRKEKEGHLAATKKTVLMGGPIKWMDYVGNAILGFLVGWKFVYLVINASSFTDNPQSHIMSSEGSILWGLVLASLAVGTKYYEDLKLRKKYPKPTKVEGMEHPWQLMSTMTLFAAVAGFIGAKLFDHLEHWESFVQNPFAAFLDPFSGLTFYGGLIMGGAAVLWFAHTHGIHWRHMLDVGGPTMMLAYAMGRVGCHMSGDGDWGIVNPAPKPNGFTWLPDWLWSYTYPNNVAKICDPFTSGRCLNGEEVVLSAGVWPTPIFETIMGIILFAILWRLRTKFKAPGVLFGVYMVFAGLERFFIEKIRVNIKYHFGSLEITQAELISVAMMAVGLIGIWYFSKNPEVVNPKVKEEKTPD